MAGGGRLKDCSVEEGQAPSLPAISVEAAGVRGILGRAMLSYASVQDDNLIRTPIRLIRWFSASLLRGGEW